MRVATVPLPLVPAMCTHFRPGFRVAQTGHEGLHPGKACAGAHAGKAVKVFHGFKTCHRSSSFLQSGRMFSGRCAEECRTYAETAADTGRRTARRIRRKSDPYIGELAGPAGHQQLDGFIGVGHQQAEQQRPADVPHHLPGVNPKAEHGQKAQKGVFGKVGQLADLMGGRPPGLPWPERG